ncbi:uncharacterized protein LOC125469051 [Pyrus x bretschneideri]|uniref:uncharacterized protein LOC125469051 n=1 Tax=Pyrus x bretschneideri TaxID=225117 RepID=UPI00202F1540|nr:uncharacterized protein LOC125469051 [Pyrus x bretschneideri]
MYKKKPLWDEGIIPKPPRLSAELSFLRVCGLLKFLRSVAESGSSISLFSQTQSLPELQVVPTLFRHSLTDSDDEIVQNLDHIFGVEPLKITNPSTDSGVSLALGVLEGCCLLHPDSAVLAHQHKAIQVLMNILPNRGVIEQGACLDALIAIMLDSSANQMVKLQTSVSRQIYCDWFRSGDWVL